ncbi:MAG: glycosyltransferase family 9 protein [Candidatus Latescibacteria bacterium]|nr:glycosyltransferase family 9 protein [Candidatus Latescibacterota bacterium]
MRILVIRTGAIGDFILTLPVLTALRRAFPGVSLDVMGVPSIARLAVSGQEAGALLSIDRADLAPFFVRDAPLPPDLTEAFSQYEMIVSFLPDRDGVFAANLARAGAGRVLTGSPIPPDGHRLHATHHLIRALAPLGIEVRASVPRLCPSPDDRRRAEAFLAERGFTRPAALMAVHPGSGGRWKCWPPDRYAALIDALHTRNIPSLLSAGPADAEVVNAIRASLTRATPLIANQLDLPLLAAVLVRCRGMIGNDSGMTHLAAAAGVPTIALFGPTDPAVWGPRGQQVTILWGEDTFHGDVGEMDWPSAVQFPPLTAITVDRALRTVGGSFSL